MKPRIIVRKNYKKSNGLYPVYLFLYIQKKQKMISLDIEVNINNFNEKTQRLSGKEENSFQKNTLIEKTLNDANKIIFDYKINDWILTADIFTDLLRNGTPTLDYFEFVKKEIELKEGSISTEYLRQLKGELSKLKKFRKNISLTDINYQFLQEYENYMRNILFNQTNTVTKTFKKIRTFLNIALNKNLIKANPFKQYKLKNEQTDRVYLTKEEVNKIHIFMNKCTDNTLINVSRLFLFSCYTGLRISDIKNLSWAAVVNNSELKIKSLKTKKYQTIPLNDKAKDLLPFNNDIDYYVFKVNPDFNKYLKLIAARAGINKEFSFHSGRHTFATLCLSLDIPIEVVQEYLAHTDIRTTKIYAKIIDESKKRHMDKFNVL